MAVQTQKYDLTAVLAPFILSVHNYIASSESHNVLHWW